MLISGVYALTTQNLTAALNTGFVDIKLNTYKLNSENEEVEYEDNGALIPGGSISFIPKITNLGANCYLRIKVNYISDNIDFRDYVTGFSEDFVKYGDYYYYNKVLNQNEVVELFNTVIIPNNVESITNNKKLNLEIIAEAIQESNFEPDYTKQNPWKDIVPTENENNAYNIDINDDKTVVIKFDDDTQNDISIPDGFLEKMRNVMPGDTFSETIEIENTYLDKAKFYLKFNPNDSNEKEIELLNRIYLQIKNKNGELIYEGNFLSENNILLTELATKEKDSLEFKISVPIELSNEYSNLSPKLLLVFSSDKKKNNSNTDTSKETNENKGTDNSNTQFVAQDNSNKRIVELFRNPSTGDKVTIAMIVFIISAICLIITMVLDFIVRKKE